MVRIERFTDVAAFFDRAAPYLERNEAAHTLQLGFRDRLERDPHAFGPHDPVLYAVHDGDDVVGVATETPPLPPALSVFEDETAVDALAERMYADALVLTGVLAPVALGERFVAQWSALAGARSEVAVEQRIFEATEVIPPRPVGGRMRPYEPADRPLVLEWLAGFFEDAMAGSLEADPEGFLTRKERDPTGALMLWDDGGPVSLAGYGAPSPNGLRVGPVYTPRELRGRGYASALTAAVTETILASGRRFAFLFTDLANPTSNSIYRRIGYRPVLDVTRWTFS